MKLDYFNTFDVTTSPSYFAWVCAGGGSNNLVYNATYQAIDCPGFNYTFAGVSTLTKTNFDNNCVYEADLELVADRAGNKIVGLSLVSNFTSGVIASYIFYHFNASWYAAITTRYSDHTDVSSTILSLTPLSNPTFNVGERKVLKIEFQYGLYRCYVDGTEIFRFSNVTITGLMPAVYYGNATLRIHSMKFQVGDDAVVSLSTLKSGFVWANNETRSQAWPGEISLHPIQQQPAKSFSVSSLSALFSPPKRDELGYLSGQVTRKKVPAAGQLVYCFDERFNLVAEKVSDANGMYRFDGLLKQKLYTVIAQDNFDFKYAPVGADRRTPESYP